MIGRDLAAIEVQSIVTTAVASTASICTAPLSGCNRMHVLGSAAPGAGYPVLICTPVSRQSKDAGVFTDHAAAGGLYKGAALFFSFTGHAADTFTWIPLNLLDIGTYMRKKKRS